MRHKLFPEPGAWVLHKIQGIKDIEPPDKPIAKGLTVEEVAREVEYHGLGLCIYSYIFAKFIRDKELRRRWTVARRALVDVVTYLEDRNIPKKKPLRLKKGKKLT